jgi:hypothetical protein
LGRSCTRAWRRARILRAVSAGQQPTFPAPRQAPGGPATGRALRQRQSTPFLSRERASMSNRHRTAVSIWSTPNKRIKAFETAVPGARVAEIQRVPLPPPQQADEPGPPGPRVGPKLRTFMTGPVDRRGSHFRPHDPVEGSSADPQDPGVVPPRRRPGAPARRRPPGARISPRTRHGSPPSPERGDPGWMRIHAPVPSSISKRISAWPSAWTTPRRPQM